MQRQWHNGWNLCTVTSHDVLFSHQVQKKIARDHLVATKGRSENAERTGTQEWSTMYNVGGFHRFCFHSHRYRRKNTYTENMGHLCANGILRIWKYILECSWDFGLIPAAAHPKCQAPCPYQVIKGTCSLSDYMFHSLTCSVFSTQQAYLEQTYSKIFQVYASKVFLSMPYIQL